MKITSIAVLNEFVKVHNSKKIGNLTVQIVMKYIHLCDIAYYEKYQERMIEDLTLYSDFGPFYEIIMRLLKCFGFKKEITFQIPLERYDLNGDSIGHYIPEVKEKRKLDIINLIYQTYSQLDYEKLLDLVSNKNMPAGIAKNKRSMYVEEKIFKEFHERLKLIKNEELK